MAKTHALMSSNLAKALMESGVKHFDLGGLVGDAVSGPFSLVGSGVGSAVGSLNSGLGPIASSGYQAQLAPTTQTNYSPNINTAGSNALAGYGTNQSVLSQQQSLANQLLAQSQGAGPNPALTQLNQTTGQNAQQQAALMASQRGSSANAGLLARQAAMQGGALNETAAGNAATLEANQQLAAEGALEGQQNNIQSANLGEQNLNANLYGTSATAQNAQNNSTIQNYAQEQNINSGVAAGNQKTQAGVLGGILGAGGSLGAAAAGSPGAAAAGSKGGSVDDNKIAPPKGKNPLPDHLHKMASIYHPDFAAGATDFRSGGPVPGKEVVKGNSVKNDVIPAMLSSGEDVLPKSVTQSANAPQKAAEFVAALQEKQGKKPVSKGGYEKVADSKKGLKDLKSRVDRLEKLCAGGMA